jgi:phosphoribosylformimino-5-aminoimidazole carboxamide ribonucleotide (ProFAR) isomerase
MILVIPEIELSQGRCITKIKGEKGTESFYTQLTAEPNEFCRLLRRENTKSILITDRDSILKEENSENRKSIIRIKESLDIPINVYINFKSVEGCRFMLDSGIHRIVVDEIVLNDTDGLKRIIDEFSSSRIILRVLVSNRQLLFTEQDFSMNDLEFIKIAKKLGINRILYGDIDWITGNEPEIIPILREIASYSKMHITVLNGVYNAPQLWRINELQQEGIDSVVIGDSLYSNNFPCESIWREIEAEVELN